MLLALFILRAVKWTAVPVGARPSDELAHKAADAVFNTACRIVKKTLQVGYRASRTGVSSPHDNIGCITGEDLLTDSDQPVSAQVSGCSLAAIYRDGLSSKRSDREPSVRPARCFCSPVNITVIIKVCLSAVTTFAAVFRAGNARAVQEEAAAGWAS